MDLYEAIMIGASSMGISAEDFMRKVANKLHKMDVDDNVRTWLSDHEMRQKQDLVDAIVNKYIDNEKKYNTANVWVGIYQAYNQVKEEDEETV